LLILVFAGEEWNSTVEFNEYAPERPHVDSCRVLDAKDDFWGAIEATLDVRVYLLSFETPTSHINHLNAALVLLLHQDVFRF
jgi:hypothetical protein